MRLALRAAVALARSAADRRRDAARGRRRQACPSFAPKPAKPAAETAPPSEIQALLNLLADPKVQAWLTQQKKTEAATADSTKPAFESPDEMMSSRVEAVREHIAGMVDVMPTMPAQFAHAADVFHAKLGDRRPERILGLVAAFAALGFGAEGAVLACDQAAPPSSRNASGRDRRRPRAPRRRARGHCAGIGRCFRHRQHRRVSRVQVAIAAAPDHIGLPDRLSGDPHRRRSRPFFVGAVPRALSCLPDGGGSGPVLVCATEARRRMAGARPGDKGGARRARSFAAGARHRRLRLWARHAGDLARSHLAPAGGRRRSGTGDRCAKTAI